jgi:hypothetical protein
MPELEGILYRKQQPEQPVFGKYRQLKSTGYPVKY